MILFCVTCTTHFEASACCRIMAHYCTLTTLRSGGFLLISDFTCKGLDSELDLMRLYGEKDRAQRIELSGGLQFVSALVSFDANKMFQRFLFS